jgi:hypothetical protein
MSEEARLNALALGKHFAPEFTASTKSQMIDRHSGYRQAGDKDRHPASQRFFGQLSLLNVLDETEKHSMISHAAKRLLSVHQGYDNFYNEPPFAQRLAELTSDVAVPATAREEFVSAVVTCAIGNQYGSSNAAEVYYEQMVKSFTPAEVEALLNLIQKQNVISIRIKSFPRCRAAFKGLLKKIDAQSVSVKHKRITQPTPPKTSVRCLGNLPPSS